MTPVLELRDVHASYDGAVVAQGVSFAVAEGESVGLVGRNGAGKTTVLLSVYRVPAVTGEILVDGRPLGRRRYRPAALGISLVPQGKRIFGNLTVEENLRLGTASGRSGQWTVDSVLALFPNLARSRARRGTALSGGEQQMLAIGRALLAQPRLLMLDEPTEGLAPVVIDELVAALGEIRGAGTGLLVVEQRVSVISRLADRFLALRRGQLVGAGPVADLETRAVQELIAL